MLEFGFCHFADFTTACTNKFANADVVVREGGEQQKPLEQVEVLALGKFGEEEFGTALEQCLQDVEGVPEATPVVGEELVVDELEDLDALVVLEGKTSDAFEVHAILGKLRAVDLGVRKCVEQEERFVRWSSSVEQRR